MLFSDAHKHRNSSWLWLRLMRGMAVVSAAALSLMALPALSDGFQLKGQIIDAASPNKPGFGTPFVTIEFLEGSVYSKEAVRIFELIPEINLASGRHYFDNFIGEPDIGRTWAFIHVQAGEYLLNDNGVRRKYIPADAGDAGLVPITLKLLRRAAIAEGSRREAVNALNRDDPGPADFERAAAAARHAIEIDTKLDNYLLLITSARKAMRSGYFDLIGELNSIEDLGALRGFESLSFRERWRVQSELLATLVSLQDLSAPVSFDQTLSSAAVELAERMIDTLEPTADYAQLPAIRVFRTLSKLHGLEDDCESLVASNRTALGFADAVAMNWSSQRTFLLEWGDCLEKMSRRGDGRSLEVYVAETAAITPLVNGWGEFEATAAKTSDKFAFPTRSDDLRLLAMFQTAQQITQGEQ